MADRASADRACKDPNPIIDGRKANVNLAYLGAKPRVMQPGEVLDVLVDGSATGLYHSLDNQGGVQRQQPLNAFTNTCCGDSHCCNISSVIFLSW